MLIQLLEIKIQNKIDFLLFLEQIIFTKEILELYYFISLINYPLPYVQKTLK